MRVEKALLKVDRDYEKFARNMAIMKTSMDRASFLYNEKLEIARKLKNRGQPLVEIAEDTGIPLTDIEKL